MKTIRRFFNNAEAGFAQSLLTSAGIEAVLADDNMNSMYASFAMRARLQVREEDEARAREILDGHGEFTPLPDDFVPPEEASGGEKGEGIIRRFQSDMALPSVEGFNKLRGLIPAGLCVLAVMAACYALFTQLAPLRWTHSTAELVNMGNIALRKQDYVKALKYYDAALLMNPRDRVAYYDRGLAFFREKDYEKAAADFTQAIEISAGYTKSYEMRGSAYYRLGKYDLALNDLNEVVALESEKAASYTNRGLLYSKIGDAGKAMDDYKHAAWLDADDWKPINNEAWIYATWPAAEVRDGAKAMELATKACEMSEWKDYYCIGSLAAAEAETGKFSDALKHGEQALEMAKAENTADAKLIKWRKRWRITSRGSLTGM